MRPEWDNSKGYKDPSEMFQTPLTSAFKLLKEHFIHLKQLRTNILANPLGEKFTLTRNYKKVLDTRGLLVTDLTPYQQFKLPHQQKLELGLAVLDVRSLGVPTVHVNHS